MIDVLPEAEWGINAVAPVDLPVSVSTVRAFVELGEGKETVGFGHCGLRGEVSKQLRAIIDPPVAVSIQCEKRIVVFRNSPGHLPTC